MKKLYMLIIIASFGFGSVAQPSFQRLLPLLIGNYYQLQFFDTLEGYYYTDYGLAKTTDGGKHWVHQNDDYHYSKFFINKNIGFSLYSINQLKKTTDAGNTWTKISGNIPHSVNKFYVFDEQKFVAWSTYSSEITYISVDSGHSWSADTFSNNIIEVFFIDTDNGWVICKGGVIYNTNDGGINWIAQNSKITEDLYSIYFISKDTGWIAGASGRLLKTIDGGSNWTVKTITNKTLYSVKFIDANYGMVSAGSELLITKNGGNSWQSKFINIGRKFELIDSLHCYSYYNTLFFSDDFGQNWTRQLPIQGNFRSVYFSDSKNGWSCKNYSSSSPGIYHTSDGGNNWTNQFDSIFGEPECIYAINNHVWASGSLYGIYHSSNNGLSWKIISNKQFNKIKFIDTLHGFGVYSYDFYKTTDGGINWTKIYTANNSINTYDFQFIDTSYGYLISSGHSNNGQILKTSNGGATWTTVYSNSSEGLKTIHFINGKTGWVGGTSGLLVATNDSAKNWSFQSSGTYYDIKDMWMINKDTGIIIHNHDDLKITSNGGQNWTDLNTINTEYIQFNMSGFGWTYGDEILYKINNYGLACNFNVTLGNDTAIYIYDSINLTSGSGHRDYLWYDGSTTSSILLDGFSLGLGTHDIIVKTTSQTGCEDIDTLRLTVNGCNKTLNIGKDTSIYNYQSIYLSVDTAFTAYKWFDNSTTQSINLSGSSLGIGTHTVYVRAMDANGCMGGDTLILTVNGCTFSYYGLGNDTFIYNSQKITLTADSGYAEYTWNDNSKIRTFEVDGRLLAPGDFTYVVTLRDSLNCVGVDSIKITVKACNIQLTLGNDTTFCDGNNLKLDAGNKYNSYNWNNGAASTQVFTAATTGDYFVFVTDSNSCQAYSDTIHILVNSLPHLTLRDDTSFCFGNQVDIKADVGYSSYLWNTNKTQATITVNSSGNYYVYVSDSNGCSNYSDTAIITVYPLPDVKLGNDQSFCDGKSTTLDAGSGYLNYSWSNSGSANQYLTIAKSGNYFVYVTDQHQCSNYSDTVIITVYPLPDVFIGNDTALCDGDVLELDAGSHFSYNWNNGLSSKQQYDVKSAGTYYVYVTSYDGCSDTSNKINVVYNALPFTYIGNDTSIYDNQYLTLNAGSGFKEYKWQNNSNDSIYTINGSMVGLGQHTYYVRVTDSNNCEYTDTIIVTVKKHIGLNENAEILFSLYPNPAKDQLIISCNLIGEKQIQIIDMSGKIIRELQFDNYMNKQSINISSIPKGMYMLRITMEKGVGLKNFVKM